MNKKTLTQIAYIREALGELLSGAKGEGMFSWGNAEGDSKMAYLSRLGLVLVSKSKLERGGHRLKRAAKPVGRRYYGAPLKVWAELYLLGVQTERTLKWHDLYKKGTALCEDGSYAYKPSATDEERKLFQRRLTQCADLLMDAYIELRKQDVPQDDPVTGEIAALLDEVFDRNAEMYFRTVEDTANDQEKERQS